MKTNKMRTGGGHRPSVLFKYKEPRLQFPVLRLFQVHYPDPFDPQYCKIS